MKQLDLKILKYVAVKLQLRLNCNGKAEYKEVNSIINKTVVVFYKRQNYWIVGASACNISGSPKIVKKTQFNKKLH